MREIQNKILVIGIANAKAANLILKLAGLGGGLPLRTGPEHGLKHGGQLRRIGALQRNDPYLGIHMRGGLVESADHLLHLFTRRTACDDQKTPISGIQRHTHRITGTRRVQLSDHLLHHRQRLFGRGVL